jgi:hypothetical protein
MMAKKPMAELTGNIIEHMKLMSALKDQKYKHFHYDCKLWKAIYDAVANGDDLVAHPKDYLLMCYRGTGRAVSLRETRLWGKNYDNDPPTECPFAGMDVEVEYTHEDNNGMEHPETINKTYTLQPPIELLTEFNKDEFDVWVSKVKEKRDAETKEKELATLKELREKYPND